jgi:hypothetical protein
MANRVQENVYDLVDELTPEGLDWEHLVKTYPIPALALAALGGFLLGRARGPAILAAVSGFAADEISRGINEALGRDVL